jgi:transposase-like protein
LQIKRQTGLSYKSALFLMHRIRHAMTGSDTRPLSGDVEVDETYVGGKPRGPSKATPEYRKLTGYKGKKGRGPDFADRKTPVLALVSRTGGARAYVPTDVKGHNLKEAIRKNVDPSATIHTDQYIGYRGIGADFDGGHHTVNHVNKEYVRYDADQLVTTNTVEAFFSLLKRGIIGTFHNVSRKHLHRYVSEFEFRWNTRKMDDGARIKAAVRGAEGKRLMYRHP